MRTTKRKRSKPDSATNFTGPHTSSEGLRCVWFFEEHWQENTYFLYNLKESDSKKVQRFIYRIFKAKWTGAFDTTAKCLNVDQGLGRRGQIILMGPWKGTPENYAVLAHELVHAVHNILNRRGLKLSDETDEVYAYLMQLLMAKIANAV